MDVFTQLGESSSSLQGKYQAEKFADGVNGNTCAYREKRFFLKKCHTQAQVILGAQTQIHSFYYNSH